MKVFKYLQIKPGLTKTQEPETFECFALEKGKVYTIVGKTGSGKTQLIEDIESLANGSGLTKRTILLDNEIPSDTLRYAPHNQLVSHLSQNMHFILDMLVKDFIELHARCRGVSNCSGQVEKILYHANILCGEKIRATEKLTNLSGGQSRALMIADIAVNSSTPIILIDEIENAGINKLKAVDMLLDNKKIIIIVTHDPLLALSGDQRVVMSNGGISRIMTRSNYEIEILSLLNKSDKVLSNIRNALRQGRSLRGVSTDDLQVILE